jgi:tetratricopeptide (TPR) repeat protein
LASGRPGDAAVELEQVVAAAPELGSARLMLAEAVAASGRLDDALASFDAAAALMPHAAEPRLAAGRALEARGRFDAAAEAYRDAAVREPASAEAARALLSLRAGRGDLARGIAELDRLASDHPRSAALRVAHAEALHRGGDPAGAARAVDAALELDPDRVDALLLRANLHAEAGRTGEAAALYRTILRQRPDLPAAEWGLARALVAGGSDEDAVAAIDAFAARYPGRAQGDVLRGMLFERRGDTPAAVRAYESALAIDPGNAAARRGLERLLSGKASR